MKPEIQRPNLPDYIVIKLQEYLDYIELGDPDGSYPGQINMDWFEQLEDQLFIRFVAWACGDVPEITMTHDLQSVDSPTVNWIMDQLNERS